MLDQREINLQPASLDEVKHLVSDRAIEGDTVLLNMGPQHPATHGVLRLLLELDGEVVVNCIPDIGFLHTGVEKNMEAKTYIQAEVMTDRLDYLNTVGNNLAYCLAVEKLTGLDVPPRAQSIRVILTRKTASKKRKRSCVTGKCSNPDQENKKSIHESSEKKINRIHLSPAPAYAVTACNRIERRADTQNKCFRGTG